MPLDMYAEEIIYNYEHPTTKGRIEGATATMHEENISCGDIMTVYLKLEKGRIADVKFEGTGCVISMGTANILLEYIKGKTLNYLEKMGLSDLLGLINIDPGPVRLHCATLSLRALKKAALEYERKPIDTATKEL